MTTLETDPRTLIRSYLSALASGAAGEELRPFFVPDAVQIELPNRLNPKGGTSDLTRLLARSEQGRHLFSAQSYEIRSETAEDERVAVEAVWTGTLAVPLGSLAAGATMRAFFSMHFEMRDGKIAVQRNYDCFEPW